MPDLGGTLCLAVCVCENKRVGEGKADEFAL